MVDIQHQKSTDSKDTSYMATCYSNQICTEFTSLVWFKLKLFITDVIKLNYWVNAAVAFNVDNALGQKKKKLYNKHNSLFIQLIYWHSRHIPPSDNKDFFNRANQYKLTDL